MAGTARSWRWPWQPPAGMVRVSKDAYIETLSGALRAAELEAECLALDGEKARLLRMVRARDLIEQQTTASGVLLGAGDTEDLVADLPQCLDGGLHEAAFLALLGQHLMERQFGARIPTTSSRNGDDRS